MPAACTSRKERSDEPDQRYGEPSVELVDLGKPGVPGVLGIRRPSSLPVGGFSHVDGTPLCWAGEPIKRREFRF